MSFLAWIAWNDPAINFLGRDKRAEWIVFPAAVDAHAHWFASLDATFRREFDLKDRPPRALLSVRAMRRAEVKINGTPIHFRPNSNWKKIVSADVAEQLHAGTNVIEARVFNYNGPPALWLTFTTDQLSLRTIKVGKHLLRVLHGVMPHWLAGEDSRSLAIPLPVAKARLML